MRLQPSIVTFGAVISACARGGQQGRKKPYLPCGRYGGLPDYGVVLGYSKYQVRKNQHFDSLAYAELLEIIGFSDI